jgi:hypothetical protein
MSTVGDVTCTGPPIGKTARVLKFSCRLCSPESSTSLQLEAITSRIAHIVKITLLQKSYVLAITHFPYPDIMHLQSAPRSLRRHSFAGASEALMHESELAFKQALKQAFPLITHSGSEHLSHRQQCLVPASYTHIDIVEPRVHKSIPPVRHDSCHQVPDRSLVRKPLPVSTSLQKPELDDVPGVQAPSNPNPSCRERDSPILFSDRTHYISNRDTILYSNIRASTSSTASHLSRDHGSIQKQVKATLHVANVPGPIARNAYCILPSVREFTGAYGEDLSRSLDGDSGLLDKGRETRQLHRNVSAMVVYEAKDKMRKMREQVSQQVSQQVSNLRSLL